MNNEIDQKTLDNRTKCVRTNKETITNRWRWCFQLCCNCTGGLRTCCWGGYRRSCCAVGVALGVCSWSWSQWDRGADTLCCTDSCSDSFRYCPLPEECMLGQIQITVSMVTWAGGNLANCNFKLSGLKLMTLTWFIRMTRSRVVQITLVIVFARITDLFCIIQEP